MAIKVPGTATFQVHCLILSYVSLPKSSFYVSIVLALEYSPIAVSISSLNDKFGYYIGCLIFPESSLTHHYSLGKSSDLSALSSVPAGSRLFCLGWLCSASHG